MNQFFSFRRFSLLISKHWADNKKRYLLSVIGFALLLIVWFIFTILVDPHSPMQQEVQILTFFFALFGTGAFYASQYFRDLGSRAKGINFLLVPASAVEKILCSILFTIVIFFSVFTAVFYLVDVLMVTISNQFLTSHNPIRQEGVINVFRAAILPFDGISTLNVLLIFFTVQSIFLLGSVYFAKYSFIKTVICSFVVFFLLFCLIYVLYEYVMPRGGYVNGFTSYRVSRFNAGEDHLVQIPGWIDDMIYFVLMYAITPFLWVVSYYRLKEKQV
ncbi:hypothetical protein LZZ85_12795 [Terrimonas sp. NA20]|uniref:ABC transporter permease n=1 Tax=Terrimonas ginsenosidimutans TaxID=2908004 RepID=A0ABS9KS71_9BACT|nr:hypothetical protein [Terrimonas ginsenosidimutans]MCG2615170.1 hypothetical protein [Terrimonas ginsenosidimutans]